MTLDLFAYCCAGRTAAAFPPLYLPPSRAHASSMSVWLFRSEGGRNGATAAQGERAIGATFFIRPF